MDLQYLSDSDGKPTAVVIPIEDWQRLTHQHEDLRDLEQPARKTMASYKGVLSPDEAENLQSYVTQSRDEWSQGF